LPLDRRAARRIAVRREQPRWRGDVQRRASRGRTGGSAGMSKFGEVCVIDDDDDVRGALGSLLRSAGHAVRLYPSPDAFLGDGPPESASCLVLDIRLPGENGL